MTTWLDEIEYNNKLVREHLPDLGEDESERMARVIRELLRYVEHAYLWLASDDVKELLEDSQ